MRHDLSRMLLAAALILMIPGVLLANTSRKNAWLAAYPDACQTLVDAANSCTLCHADGALTSYASDYNGSWTDIADLDSDNDTVSNGREIELCTLPGDATSVTPADENTWGRIKALYR
jgi:hypothetical protein